MFKLKVCHTLPNAHINFVIAIKNNFSTTYSRIKLSLKYTLMKSK